MDDFSKVKIAFYSGTGGTERAAILLAKGLARRGKSVGVERITTGLLQSKAPYDLLVLMFPLHAQNAPQAVYDWIAEPEVVGTKPAAVISVCGMGDMCPNRAGRKSAIERLERKGFKVLYENYLVMPSSYLFSAPRTVNERLVELLPTRVDAIALDLVQGLCRRTHPPLIDRLVSMVGESFKGGTAAFGKGLSVTDDCDGCGWCAKHCSANNISLYNGRPQIADLCHQCLACIYGCPKQAIKPAKMTGIIPEGYDLDDLERYRDLTASDDFEIKGVLWSGVRRYMRIK